jgi:hypothetical protein
VTAVLASAIRDAAAFLAAQGFKPGEISAPMLAGAAAELGTDLKDTLTMLGSLMTAQGQGPAPAARRKLSNADRQALESVDL